MRSESFWLPKPICPRCGEPAQVVILLKARVRCELLPSGESGRVLSASRDKHTITGYECGGGHVWEST